MPAAEVAFESSVWGVAEECGDARLERCPAFVSVSGALQSVQRAEFGVPSLLCRPIGLAIWVLITSMLLRLLAACWIGVVLLHHCRWLRMGFGRSCSANDLYWKSGYC